MRLRERVLSLLAIFGSFIGGLGLILLTIFDTRRLESLHRIFLLIFVLGVALSAGFTCLEVCPKATSHRFWSPNVMLQFRWISKDFEEIRKLKQAYCAKAIIVTILVSLSIGFGVALYYGNKRGGNPERAIYVGGASWVRVLFLRTHMLTVFTAILEWLIAFGFVFYLLTFYFDLRMSKGMHKGDLNKGRLMAIRRMLANGGRYVKCWA
jgi:hypothetical protein